jgi:hypothetical protein
MKKKCIHATKPKRGPYPNRMIERVDSASKDDAAREKALMRHPWYRQKKARDAREALAA